MTDTSLRLTEYGRWQAVRLSAATGQALAASGVVEARPDADVPGDPTCWQIRALNYVGVARIHDTELRIAPKLPIRRLFFLLGYVADPYGVKRSDGGEVQVGEDIDLLPAIAHTFERLAERALRQGLLQGYRHTEESTAVVLGRIRETEQLRRRFGLALPVEVSYDEFTADIVENRLLLAATLRLLRLPGVHPDVRKRLLALRARLAGVGVLTPGHLLPRWRPSRLNARYHPALRFAELILNSASVEHQQGAVRIDGFLFDMNKVFEDFVCLALREVLRERGGCAELQARHIHLDAAETIRVKPDFVWYDESGRPRAVVDAKYKAERPGGFPDADLYQILAYCTALHLPTGHLVYAKGNAPRATHFIRNAGIHIQQHSLDLDQAPAGLLADLAGIAALLEDSEPAVEIRVLRGEEGS
ncbi:McrC family protein [Streptomyces mangrovisoli]|uniref:Restriction endonuclease n=1 Tax=Streptomyces mangrovisoli TaxID=1428628 RepID=A0A1J4NJT1_9ACTN|nr:McrBC 5-methylcytosine restriction system component [Streptomyces mangrovisoli]OIJ62559.1 restriction endonuclease [Streptomyces mangrovisoli]